jgi:hypothetical protein
MTGLGKYVSNGTATLNGYPNPNYFLGNFSTDPTNTSPGQWWYNTTTGQIKANINGTITVISSTTPIKTDADGNILANINAQNIIPSANPTSFPNPAYYLGSVYSDPPNTSSGQWWYNTTTMQIKQNVNGTIQILGAFASSFSATTYITNDTTIGGSGITVNYINLVILNNATLTVASGTTVNVAGVLNIMPGSTLILEGATLNVYNALQNAGTLQSTSTSDSILAVQLQNSGNIQIDGTLYLPNAGYNHFLAGSISGTGTLNIQGTAITLIGEILNLSIPTVTGNGTYQIQQNGVCAINGNATFSIPIVTGLGTLSIASGYTLTIGANVTFLISTVSGSGTLSIPSGYILTIGANVTFSVATVSGAGTLIIPSGRTLTFSGSNLIPTTLTANGILALSGNYTLVTNITNGTGTLQINSGYTLTVSSNITLGFSTITGEGTLLVASGYTLTQGSAITVSISNISVVGTWANAGYGITIPSGATVSWNVSGSITTSYISGTLTVNGRCYWIGYGISPSDDTQISFPLRFAGTGIFIGAPAGKGSGTVDVLLLYSTSINAGSNDGYDVASGGIPYYTFSSIQGSAVGKYTLGTYDSDKNSYSGFVLIYIGTANTSYTVSRSFGYTQIDTPGDTVYARNMTGSAGTITITGTLHV